CLKDYLEPYTTILRKYKFKYYYVDAFAGAGRAKLRVRKPSITESDGWLFDDIEKSPEEEQYIKGSPYQALSIKYPFQGYLFIEYNADNAKILDRLKDEFPHLKNKIRIKVGDANKVLLESLVNNTEIDWKGTRAVVFLDPFGMQVSWDTIKSLAGTKAIEVIINNPIHMVVQRLLQKKGNIPPAREELLNSYFGSTQWKNTVYKEISTLFGDTEKIKAHDTSVRLGQLYNEQLKECFGYAAPVRLVRNSANSPIYFLHWAGPDPT